MLEWLKSAWASSKVKVAIVGGALVVGTAYGTCTVDPGEVSDATSTITETETAGEVVPVSSETIEVTTDPTTATATETTTGTTATDETTTGTTTETE